MLGSLRSTLGSTMLRSVSALETLLSKDSMYWGAGFLRLLEGWS